MARISDKAKREAIAAAELKDKQGDRLIKDLSLWHSGVIRTFEQGIAEGFPITQLTAEQSEEMANIFSRHYWLTAKAFSPFALTVQDGKTEVTRQVQGSMIRSVERLIGSEPQRIASIGNTTEKIRYASLESAREAILSEEDVKFTAQLLAVTTGNILRHRLKEHREGLAISETEWVAEGTRQKHVREAMFPISESINETAAAVESRDKSRAEAASSQTGELAALTVSATAIKAGDKTDKEVAAFTFLAASRLRAFADKVIKQKKMWITMGDNKVRPSHKAANSQTVMDDQPFQVGSSELMYPGDGSLGADVKEIVHCRCFVHYL